MANLLGIDVGTSSCKALMIDEGGRVLAQASVEYPISTPRPGWSEQSPVDWWTGVQKCLSQIGERPDAIGLTGQMHGSVFLDGHGDVIRPALLWNDQRTGAECEEIDARVGRRRLMEITCNPPLTGFQAPKVLWLRNHEAENFAKVRHVLLPKDYIRYRLTGHLATEVSDASGVGLLDVPKRNWSHELMGLLDLDPGLFPPVHESDVVSATTHDGVPVVGGGGDQAAGAVGTGAVIPGVVSVSLGTSGVVFTSLDQPKYDSAGAAHTFCHANHSWHAMGVMLSCGGALRWYRDTFCPGMSYDEIAAEAETAEPEGGPLFLPYLTGERCPVNDPGATGCFAGIRLSHGRADFSRAVFEGITLGLLGCMNLLGDLGTQAAEIRVTGGGAKGRFWLQMLADAFGKPCVTLAADEGPAFGAAILAGVGIGIWPDTQTACQEAVKTAHRIEPRQADWRPALERSETLYQALKPWMRT